MKVKPAAHVIFSYLHYYHTSMWIILGAILLDHTACIGVEMEQNSIAADHCDALNVSTLYCSNNMFTLL